VISRFQAEAVERCHKGRNHLVPLPIGEAEIAIDQRDGTGIARRAGNEAAAEIKHLKSLRWV
jgi:hypothetical protein